jgi:hypothetical protein
MTVLSRPNFVKGESPSKILSESVSFCKAFDINCVCYSCDSSTCPIIFLVGVQFDSRNSHCRREVPQQNIVSAKQSHQEFVRTNPFLTQFETALKRFT